MYTANYIYHYFSHVLILTTVNLSIFLSAYIYFITEGPSGSKKLIKINKNEKLFCKLIVSPYKSLKIFTYFTINVLLAFTSLFDTVLFLLSSILAQRNNRHFFSIARRVKCMIKKIF